MLCYGSEKHGMYGFLRIYIIRISHDPHDFKSVGVFR
jgi:hypothetical protein